MRASQRIDNIILLALLVSLVDARSGLVLVMNMKNKIRNPLGVIRVNGITQSSFSICGNFNFLLGSSGAIPIMDR